MQLKTLSALFNMTTLIVCYCNLRLIKIGISMKLCYSTELLYMLSVPVCLNIGIRWNLSLWFACVCNADAALVQQHLL